MAIMAIVHLHSRLVRLLKRSCDCLQYTRASLEKGVKEAVAGNRVGDISFAVQSKAESGGYSVVRELVGHGLGRRLHEPPEVPNYGKQR